MLRPLFAADILEYAYQVCICEVTLGVTPASLRMFAYNARSHYHSLV